MTNAADTGAVVPTAPVFAEGAFCDSSYPYCSQIASNAPAMMSAGNVQSKPCFPLLSISGVRAFGSVRGLNWYVLPACPETSSKYRLRKAVRAALQGFVATIADWRQREVRS